MMATPAPWLDALLAAVLLIGDALAVPIYGWLIIGTLRRFAAGWNLLRGRSRRPVWRLGIRPFHR